MVASNTTFEQAGIEGTLMELRERVERIDKRLTPGFDASRISKCTLAIALLLAGESKLNRIADQLGIHRSTLYGKSFEPLHRAIGTLRAMRRFARQDGSATDDDC